MSLLSFLSKEKKLIPYGCDMHSHLIPGIDDGSDSVEESIIMIKGLLELGFDKFVCTPHIMSDFFKNNKETISIAFQELIKALEREKINIQLEFAAEYYLDEGFIQKLETKEILTFGDNYLLFETSYMNKPGNLREVIFEMLTSGYKPILAHPERYTYMFDDFSKYEELYNTGVLFQINMNSLTGYYSKASKKIAEKLIDNNMVDFLGSDCHKPRHVPIMKQAMLTKYYAKALASGLKNKSL